MRDGQLKYGLLSMKKQNPSPERGFIVERQCPKGPHFLFPAQRFANLQFKAAFFEGQLDPLQFQNLDLKETVIHLLYSISSNTDILRKLIPAENAALRLKIDMASFSEIALMIQEEWQVMSNQLQDFFKIKSGLERDVLAEQQRYKEENELRLRQKIQYEQLQCKFEEQISTLHREITKLRSENESFLKQVDKERKQSEAKMQSYQKEMHFKEYDFKCKQDEYERCISRLNKTIQALRFQYQQSKASLKALYDKVSSDKLSEQAETFELMLKLKQDEKFKLERELSEIKQLHIQQLEQKDEDISRILDRIERLKERVAELEDEIYLMKEEGKSNKMEFKTLEAELHLIRENIVISEGIIAKRETVIAEMEKQLKKTVDSYEQKIKEIIRARDERNNILQSQNRRQALLIQDLYKQLSQLKARLQFIDQEWDQKIKETAQAQKAKQAKLMEEIVRWEKNVQEEKNKAAIMVASKQKQIEKIKEYYQSVMGKLQKDFQIKRQNLIKQMAAQKKKQMQKNEEQIFHLRMELKTQLQNQKKAIHQATLLIQKECLQKMNEQEAAFQAQRKKHDQKLQLFQGADRSFKDEIQKLARKLRQADDRMQKMKASHIRQIAKLEGKNAELALTWQARMDKQLDDFQTVIMEREKQFGLRETQFYQQLQGIQAKVQNKEKQLSHFKNNQEKVMREFKQANGINVVEKRFTEEIHEMKAAALRKQAQIQASFDTKVRSLIDQFRREKQQIINFYKQKLIRQENYMEEQLVKIGSCLIEINIGKQSNIENQMKIMKGLKCAQKVTYIQEVIRNIEEYISNQRQQIKVISCRLKQVEQAIEVQVQQRKSQIQSERVQIMGKMEREIEKTVKEYNQKWKKKQEDYKLKETQSEVKWKKFSQILYQQFKLLSDTHQQEYSKLMNKYNELEKIFEIRPSRHEDIIKIKELSGIRAKLEGEIAALRKKLDTANEIVQYLNMQLQNYKQVYDIFGPNSDIGNKTVSFNFDPQKMEKYQRFLQKKVKEDLKSKSFTKDTHGQPKGSPSFEVHNSGQGRNIFEPFKNSGEKEDDNDSFVLDSKQSPKKIRKYSHFSHKKSKEKSLKTEESAPKIKGMDLFEKTSTFLKLINTPPAMDPLFRETDNDNKMKNYRRRRVKRLSTAAADQY